MKLTNELRPPKIQINITNNNTVRRIAIDGQELKNVSEVEIVPKGDTGYMQVIVTYETPRFNVLTIQEC